MPNTLAHFGFQGWLTRAGGVDVDPRWVLVGAVVPDVPWILQRAVTSTSLVLPDPYTLRVYAIAQASLFATLLLCAALALLGQAPGRIFVLLAVQSVLHLLLDASETKWANGVHLFAPFSWNLLNFGWFWPESPLVLILSLAGLAYVGWAAVTGRLPGVRIAPVPVRRCLAAVALLVLYFGVPFALLTRVEEGNSHFVATLRNRDTRSGRTVEFDRARVLVGSSGPAVTTFAGEEIMITGSGIATPGVYSLRGRFSDPGTLSVSELHKHHDQLRELASYLGLILVMLTLVLPGALRRRRRTGSGDVVPPPLG